MMILSIIIGILFVSVVLAISAFPAGPVNLRAQTCGTEIASVNPESFGGACTTTSLDVNDGTTQTATVSGNNLYMGARIQTFNSTIVNCGGITNVKLCYEWWSSSSSIGTCTVKVDYAGGASYSTASTTCPGTSANPGTICTDVTVLGPWTCDNFFGASGTRALAYLQVRSTTGGTKTLTMDALFFNVTYLADVTSPSVSILYPLNTTYTNYVTGINFSASDPNIQACWWTNNSGANNYSVSCTANITGINSSQGSNTWRVYANDSYGYINFSTVTFSVNLPPTIDNITIVPNPAGLSASLLVRGNNVNDTSSDSLNFYCSEISTNPTDSLLCSGGGNLTSLTRPYNPTCVYNHNRQAGNYTVYCRLYDGNSYSRVVNYTYQVIGDSLTTSVTSVEGDSTPSYIDTNNNGRTQILVSGSSGMLCKWSSSDLAYGSMSSSCNVTGTSANCSINDVSSEGFYTRYVACQDSYENSQTAATNLNVDFYLDYSAPTTYDDSDTQVNVPPYNVMITEEDSVDSDPKTYYCTSSVAGCTPTTSIDNGGLIIYSTPERGVNYLRYYSYDFSGNNQTIVNKTININRLSVFESASDNAGTIRGGTSVTVSTVVSDADSGQNVKLYVCSSAGANSSGCLSGTYCSAVGTANLSCGFASEEDSATHTWYAYLFDELGEAATNNPLAGSYTTDYTNPVITVVSPSNGSTITQSSVTVSISADEALSRAWYSLDDGINNVSMTNASLYIYSHSNTSIANAWYNATFWVNDSVGNDASSMITFRIDTSGGDTSAPVITIKSPGNNSYYTSSTILLNITSDEALSWAGYSNNSDVMSNLGNVSTTNWNATINLGEGRHNITFYANDSSSNKNQANKSIFIFVDLTAPSVDSFLCNDKNDSGDVVCSASVSDGIGLNYAIVSYNASGNWQNSSSIILTGTSDSVSYTISAGNTTPGTFQAQLYLYDLSGRTNMTSNDNVNIYDDLAPGIYNVSYSPNNTLDLDPGVMVNVNATIIEDYEFGDVWLMYKNSSASDWNLVNMTNLTAISVNSSVIYNASFVPQNGTWYFKINATDAAGNQNISSIYTFIVENDTSQNVSTNIPLIKSILYTERVVNNSLGNLTLNNTGDGGLVFSINLSSTLLNGRLNINYTENQSANYTSSSGSSIILAINANTTGLDSGLYDYNITVTSESGSVNYERYINIQSVFTPYLSAVIDTYSASVIKGQTNVEFIAKITNFGSKDATDVYLNWSLPSEFTITSGNASRYFATIPIEGSVTNSIRVSVSSSSADKFVNISASATSTNAEAVSQSKEVTIGSPLTVTQTETIATGGGSGGGGGGKEKPIEYSKTIEIVRGESEEFEISVDNKYSNYSLKDLTLELSGFLAQYLSVSPEKISIIPPNGKGRFIVKVKVPSYKESYEEYTLKAIIKGYVDQSGSARTYSETQNIKLIVQETSEEDRDKILGEAETMVNNMKKNGFNVENVLKLLDEARLKVGERKNKEAMDISQKIVDEGALADDGSNLIREILFSLRNPEDNSILAGRAIGDLEGNVDIGQISAGDAGFASQSVVDMTNLAVASFERGDYAMAFERAKEAKSLLLLERKGSLGLFFYLYWQFVLIGFLVLMLIAVIGRKAYRKVSVTKNIEDLNKEEESLRILIMNSQREYLTGKMSVVEYHRVNMQHEKRLAEIEKERLTLRNRRIKILGRDSALSDMDMERMQVESAIKKLQEDFYKNNKVSEQEYKIQFNILNKRLAEIEGERLTFEMAKKKKFVRDHD